MKRIRISLMLVFPLFSSMQVFNHTIDSPQEVAQGVHKLVNQYRSKIGMYPLRITIELNEIALKHSQAMASGEVPFSHDGFEERVEAVKKYAKTPYRVAENLYATTSKSYVSNEALKGWLESPGHKKNIHGNWIFTGIGVARSAQGEYFITQLFVGKQSGIAQAPR